jgi:hypothetical protein
MSIWKTIDVETCDTPDEGDPVQYVVMHILQWERLVKVYGIDKSDLRLYYEREPIEPQETNQP